jgi:hypothetical protein
MGNLMNITDLYIFSQFYTSGGMCNSTINWAVCSSAMYILGIYFVYESCSMFMICFGFFGCLFM